MTTPAPIGFALITYVEPPQVVRLATRLRELYGPGAPIALHHNFDNTPLDVARLPPDVRVVRPHLVTGWGVWNTVEATLRTLELLYQDGGPDHVALLSGTDYPTAAPAKVVQDLRAGGADAYIDARPVYPWHRDPIPPPPLGYGVNHGAWNQRVCFRRYYKRTFRWRSSKTLRFHVRSRLLAPLVSPFSRRFRCYAGEHWWTLGRRAVHQLLETRRARPDLVRWFAAHETPEEAYVHTAVLNGAGLRIDPRHFRYIDWRQGGPNPRTLGMADLPAIEASGAHFARKFAPDDPALDALDARLGLPPWGSGA